MPWKLYWKILLFVTATFMSLPPSPNTKMPEPDVEPELAVAATPMVLLRTRAFMSPVNAPAAEERTRIASPSEPFSVLLRMSNVMLPIEPVTNRLPLGSGPTNAFAPVLSKLFPSATSGPPITASIVEPELAAAFSQSMCEPLMSDDFSVKFSVVPAFCASNVMLLLPPATLLKPKVVPLIVSRFSAPRVLTTFKLSSKPPSIRQEVIAPLPVKLSNCTALSSLVPLLPLVPLTVENSSDKVAGIETADTVVLVRAVDPDATQRHVPAFSRYTPLPDLRRRRLSLR